MMGEELHAVDCSVFGHLCQLCYMQQDAVLEGMLARGHKVTGVFPQKYHSQHENYTEILVRER